MSVGPAVLDADRVTDPAAARTPAPRGWRGAVEHAAVVGALAWWALPLTHGLGGRSPGVLWLGVLTVLPAFAAARPWVRAPLATWAGAVLAGAALAVCAVAPTGWSGANDAAGYVYAAALLPVILAYCTSTPRRLVVAGTVAFAGLDQFVQALVPWWGGENPALRMTGTFYWHNPYAAFLIAPAVVGLGLAVAAPVRAARLAGWVCAPAACAGVVFSSSRASLATLAVGIVLIAALAVRGGRAPARRVAAAIGVCTVVVLVLPGPPLFAHWHSPLAAAADRSAEGETLGQNGHYRMQFWREAAAVARAHPWTGGGYHSMGTASQYTSPAGWARSPFAHNGYLQALSDGGLLLGLPFLAWCSGIGGAALLALRRTRLRLSGAGAVPAAAALATLGLLAHSAVDFDWSHPSNLVMVAVVGGLAASGAVRARSPRVAGPRSSVLPAAAVLLALVLTVVAVHRWADVDRIAHNGQPRLAATDIKLLSASAGLLNDPRGAAALLRRAGSGTPVPAALLRAAYSRTAQLATVDPYVEAARVRALALLGDDSRAQAQARHLLDRLGPSRQRVVAADVAVTLALAGDRPAARALLGPLLAVDLSGDLSGTADAQRVWVDVDAADKAGLLTEGPTRACVLAAAAAAAGPPPAGLGPPPKSADLPGDCTVRLHRLTH